jgi:WD40 repeat protein/tRNA A-37 threonylcarbamoyl transferase component Bud32
MTQEDNFVSDQVLDQAFGEYLIQLEQHAQLDEESLVGKYPDVASQLRLCIATVHEVQRMAGPTISEHPSATASLDTAKAFSVSEATIAADQQSATRNEAQVKLGATFGRYRIERLLGQGAMGSVYLAYDEQLHRQVALKVPKFSGDLADELKERFYREARAAATLRSANICPVYDVNEIDGIHYISMAYIDGGTLAEVIRKRSLKETRCIAELIRKLALALQKAHDRGIVHRDLKPGNVMLDSELEPIVTDFGLARRLDDNAHLTQSGALVGSPAYMSPEQIDGHADAVGPASDIYSLGVMLYELLAGRLPFQGGILSVISQVSRDEPPRPSQVSDEVVADSPLENICLKMMAKRPEDRFPNMLAVAEALRPLSRIGCDPADASQLEHKPTATKPTAAQPDANLQPPSRVRFALRLTLLFGFLIALAGVVVVLTDQGRIEIRSEVDDVRVVVERNGMAIRTVDLKTGTDFYWFPTGKYEVKPLSRENEIEVTDDGFQLKRLGKIIVTVRRKTGHENQDGLEGADHNAQEATSSILTMTGPKEFWMTRVLFSHDGTQAISTAVEGYIWDLQTGNLVRKLPPHQGDIWALALSPDGTRLLTSSFNQIRLWDFASGEMLKEFTGHESKIWTLAFTPDGKRFASAGEDPGIRVWDIDSGDQIGEISTPEVSTRSLAYSSDGKYLAAGHYVQGKPDLTTSAVRLWNAETLQPERDLTGASWTVSAVAFSPDAKTLAVSCFEQNASIRTWNVETGEQGRVFEGHAGSEYAVYTPDGRFLVSCAYEETEREQLSDRSIRVWDVNTGEEVCRFVGHEAGPLCVAVSPDGKSVLSSGKDATVRLWRLPESVTNPPIVNHSRVLNTYGSPANRVAFSPDGMSVASTSSQGSVKIHDVSSGLQLAEMSGHSGRVNGLAFSADGERLLTAAWDKTIRIWDVTSGKELKRYEGHAGLIGNAVWSPDETRIASCTHEGNAGAIWIWDADTGEVLQKLDNIHFQPFMVAFSPDGTQLLSGAHDGLARLWDVSTGKEVRKFSRHADWVISVAFSEDGKTAITASKDQSIRLWDVATGAELKKLTGHESTVENAVMSKDDRRILSGSSDGTLRLWDANSGAELQRYTGHVAGVVRVAISPDDQFAASAGADGTIRVWELPVVPVAKRTGSAANLFEIGIAIHKHLENYRTFPAAIIQQQADRKTMPYSWRVAILPFLGEQSLFDQYHFDEDWESENNLKVLQQMPAVFRDPRAKSDSNETSYLAIVGAETVISDHPVSMNDIKDGFSQTMMLAETGKRVPWTKPEDIELPADSGFPQLMPTDAGGFSILLADGSVHVIKSETDAQTLRGMCTRSGGEPIEIP